MRQALEGLAERRPGLASDYLELRAEALLSDDYQPSDMAWMDMKTNTIDVVIGPIENYEDELFGYKAAFEAYVLVKDMEWSERLAQATPRCCRSCSAGCRCRTTYKAEMPGTDSDLNAYDAIYYAGDATPAPRRSPSTCRTTRRCSSRRARAACSSRTRCAPSSTRSSCRSPRS